jgi:hypothetical protein
MHHRSIPVLPQTKQQSTDVTIADLQPLSGCDLRDLLLLDLV